MLRGRASISTFLSKFAPAHRFVEARSRGEESLYLLSSEDEARIIHLFDLSRAWMPQLGVRTEDCSEARVTVQQLLCIWAWAWCLVRSGGSASKMLSEVLDPVAAFDQPRLGVS